MLLIGVTGKIENFCWKIALTFQFLSDLLKDIMDMHSL